MKKLYKFYWDCERMGYVTGIFVADDTEVTEAVGKSVYFGEILGKHSEVYGTLKDKDVTVITEDQSFIELFEKYIGGTGYNPLEYIDEDEDEDE